MNILVIVLAIIFFVLIGLALSGLILFVKHKVVTSDVCKIFINKDKSLTKEVEGGKTLLAALTEQGIAVPSPCGGKATCKQCKVQVVEGGGEVLETDKATFNPKQIREGWRLSCQCKVKGDLSIKLPDNLLSLKKFAGTVVSNANVATFIKELIVNLPATDPITYIPGDYLQFLIPSFKTSTDDWKEGIGAEYLADWEQLGLLGQVISYDEEVEEVMRAYSIASYPAEGTRLKFNVRIATPPMSDGKIELRTPWGVGSSYIFGLKKGDQVQLSGPFGESHMVDDHRELIFLIGGAGSSFGRSHLLDLFWTKKTQRKATLWYGARSLKENIYQQEYEKLAKEFPNFSYHLVLSEPTTEDIAAGWPVDDPLKTAYLFRAFENGQLKHLEEPDECLYYVCGPPIHNQSVMELLDNYGVAKENIVLDDFGS